MFESNKNVQKFLNSASADVTISDAVAYPLLVGEICGAEIFTVIEFVDGCNPVMTVFTDQTDSDFDVTGMAVNFICKLGFKIVNCWFNDLTGADVMDFGVTDDESWYNLRNCVSLEFTE